MHFETSSHILLFLKLRAGGPFFVVLRGSKRHIGAELDKPYDESNPNITFSLALIQFVAY